jgi:hypothetical protein
LFLLNSFKGFNPWDTGTHRQPAVNDSWVAKTGFKPTDDAVEFVKALKQTNGDGINGDTMGHVPEEWWTAGVAADFPLAFQPEGGGSVPSMNWETMSVCHCKYGKQAPGKYTQTIDHWKWLEPRRMTR